MKAVNIKVKPFEYIEILDLQMSKGVNRHSEAFVKGVIADDVEDKYVTMALDMPDVEIYALDFESGEIVLFHGVVEDLKITTLNGLRVMELRLMSRSRILDTVSQITVFQNPNLTYDGLVRAVLTPNLNAEALMNCGEGVRIGQMLVQYEETAWEFLIRMASMHNDVLVANDVLPGIKLYFGFPRKPVLNEEAISPISYELKRVNDEFYCTNENKLSGFDDGGAVCFIIKERVIRHLGEEVEFLNKRLWVVGIESKMEGLELIHIYTFMDELGPRTLTKRNHKIIGASLSGRVSEVVDIRIKVALNHAHSNNTDEVMWHPYSTPYASPDGTGWYAPPEIGDDIRLFCPTDIENEAYTISDVHTARTTPRHPNAEEPQADSMALGSNGESNDAGIEEPKDHETRVIAYDEDHKIQFGLDYIFMQNKNTSVLFQNGAGIMVMSDNDVIIRSSNDISISSSTADMNVIGNTSVNVSQGSASIELTEGNAIISGSLVLTE